MSRNTQEWHGHASELRAEHFFLDVYWKNPECFILLALDKYFLPPENLPQKIFTASILWLLYVHVSNHRMIEVKATGSGAQGCFSQ